MSSFFNEILQKLITGGIENPRLEARILLAEVLKKNIAEIYTDTELSEQEQQRINVMLEQRLQHKPLDKIIGHREFYKADFKVSEDVLSPRPDTEILVEEALKLLQDDKEYRILDLGVGSGCIIESILLEKKNSYGVGVDVSAKALKVAAINADNLGLSRRIEFVNADWFVGGFEKKFSCKFDMIVTNPPYIPTADIVSLDTEVKEYDPLPALDGGKSGYDSYVRIAEITPLLLNDGGYILIEAGINQAAEINKIFSRKNLQPVKIVNDLAGIERCVIMQKAVA